jgi:tetratricopeptide (TPR) repeat protein
MAGDWEAALDIIEEARETLPDDPELLIWAAVLSEMLENMEQAEDYLEHAQDLFDTRLALFWVTVGNKRIAVGNVDMAEEAVLKALELDQEMPMAVFLKANVAEARGERLTAIDLYNQTFDLAEQSDPQLAVISKVRMGQLMQQIDPFADIATPAPEATPGL